MKHEIIPAIMPEFYEDIESLVAMVRQSATTVQLDLMDGKFVPEKTWPFKYGVDYHLQNLKKEQGGLPFWDEIDYELDLMIEKPEESLETWLGIGASRLIFHHASVGNWGFIQTIDPAIRNFTKIGLAVTLHDDLVSIQKLIDEGGFDFVQVMGIVHVGYQGEPFASEALKIIKHLRTTYPDLVLSIDGGVSEETITQLRDAGVHRFVSGSGVFGHGIAEENLKKFEAQLASE